MSSKIAEPDQELVHVVRHALRHGWVGPFSLAKLKWPTEVEEYVGLKKSTLMGGNLWSISREQLLEHLRVLLGEDGLLDLLLRLEG